MNLLIQAVKDSDMNRWYKEEILDLAEEFAFDQYDIIAKLFIGASNQIWYTDEVITILANIKQ